MTITLGQNVVSIGVQRHLANATSKLSASNERLSSGLRINRPSDDAASLSIASTLASSTRVYGQAIRNLNDGTSYLNIAQGSLEQLRDITIRQKELAEQAANGIFSGKQRSALSLEAKALTDEYNRIVSSTTFNGQKVFDVSGTNQGIRLQAGFGVGGSLVVSTTGQLATNVGTGGFVFGNYFGQTDAFISGDFNNDGHLDLLGAFGGIRFGNGDGTFQASVSSGLGAGGFIGDLNGDGIVDVVNDNGAYINDGRGNFSQVLSYASSSYVYLGDINNDGRLDIIHGNIATLGNGNGTFQAGISIPTFQSFSVADFNGDGIPDLIGTVAGQIKIASGNGNGSFGTPQNISGGLTADNAVAGDFNHDGFADFVSIDGNTIKMFLGNGAGTFQNTASYYTGQNNTSLLLQDINQDGNMDIIVPDTGTNNEFHIGVLLGNSNGTFSTYTTYDASGSGSSPSLVVGDFNEDGSLDILTTDSGGAGGSIYNGQTAKSVNAKYLDFSSAAGARQSMAILDKQLSKILGQLGGIGASQSQIGYELDTIQDRRLNFIRAQSVLTDADIAGESSIQTRTRILQQTSIAVLSQANQSPSLALRLLRDIG